MTHPLLEKHRATLEGALSAIATRGYWSPYAEMPSPKLYGETAPDDGKRAFEAHLGKRFELEVDGTVDDDSLQRIASELLANTVIEDFTVTRVQ